MRYPLHWRRWIAAVAILAPSIAQAMPLLSFTTTDLGDAVAYDFHLAANDGELRSFAVELVFTTGSGHSFLQTQVSDMDVNTESMSQMFASDPLYDPLRDTWYYDSAFPDANPVPQDTSRNGAVGM